MDNLKDRNVVVIGGSRGVGRAVVMAVAAKGARVLAVARDSRDLERLSEVEKGCRILAADATHDTAAGEILDAFEPEILVICAGALAPAAPFHEQGWDEFSANWNVDVKASFLFCKAALSRPLKPGSRIILISSGGALTGGPPTSGGYGGAKRAQMFMAGHCQAQSDRLGLELRFIALAPMTLMEGTGVGEAGLDGKAAYFNMTRAELVASIPDMGTAADVGQAVMALATGEAAGTVFTVNGAGLAAAR